MEASMIPKLIIHGGAGALENTSERADTIRAALKDILGETYEFLKQTDAMQAVLHGVRLLEDEPMFNAGKGSRYQADGTIRMSAALMDGNARRFSGVINIQAVQHPIDVAALLLQEEHRVLAGAQATEYARAKGFEAFDPGTPYRLQEHQNSVKGKTGTVGVVALDSKGAIVAGTSTGGVGGEIPGRVSDSATVAGNYATAQVGISSTGIGEEIVDYALAAGIAARMEDGMSLSEAGAKSLAAAKANGCSFGFIALDASGAILADKTTESIFYAWHDGQTQETF
jgi:L-asparaginase